MLTFCLFVCWFNLRMFVMAPMCQQDPENEEVFGVGEQSRTFVLSKILGGAWG